MAGKIYANENNGNVIEIDLLTKSQTIIATGGSRGDFVAVDPNGSLLLTQTDRICGLRRPKVAASAMRRSPAALPWQW